MKKFLIGFLALLSVIMAFSIVGCGDQGADNPTELNQWECVDPVVRYTLYEYIEDNTDFSKYPTYNSFGEKQDNCYTGFASLSQTVNIQEMVASSDYDHYLRLEISRAASAKAATLRKVALKIHVESDCTMEFSLYLGGELCALATVYAVANTASGLLFEGFDEYVWTEGSTTGGLTIMLENPAVVGNIKYGFSNLELTLKPND